MAKALGTSEAEEHRPGLHKLATVSPIIYIQSYAILVDQSSK